jgi:hypothetical protein
MTRTRLGALAALAVAFSLSISACGESDDNSFKEDYNAAVKPLTELNSNLDDSLGDSAGKSNDAIAKEFEQLADKAAQTRANLAELDPPEDAKQEFDRLLAALRDGTNDLGAVADAAKGDNPTDAARAAQELVKSGTKIQEAETALQDAVDG